MPEFKSNLHKRAVAGLQRTAAAAISGLLLTSAGCSFDSAPEASGRTDSATKAGWKPNGGAAGSTEDAAASDAKSARAEGGNGAATSTKTMRPANNGGAEARPNQAHKGRDDLDAGPASPPAEQLPRDAGEPTTKPAEPQQPQQPTDASTAPKSRCRPGVYTGTFTGSLQLIGVTLSPVTGTVRAMLELNETGGHLEFHDGRVAGVDQDGNRLTCGMSGRVNCDNFELEEGMLEDGHFRNAGSDSDTPFMGSVQAMYSEGPYSLVGTFQVQAKDSSLFTGKGTWNLILSQ